MLDALVLSAVKALAAVAPAGPTADDGSWGDGLPLLAARSASIARRQRVLRLSLFLRRRADEG